MPKKLTREQVEDKLAIWQQRLDLLHWDIRLDFDEEPEEDNALAEIACHQQYDRAVILFAQGWREWDPKSIGNARHSLDYLLAHELVHAKMRDLDQSVLNDLDGMIHPDAYRVFTEVFHRNRERVVDGMAVALVNGWGEA